MATTSNAAPARQTRRLCGPFIKRTLRELLNCRWFTGLITTICARLREFS
jgi:hypothetical protein